MAYVGVRVEPPVRLVADAETVELLMKLHLRHRWDGPEARELGLRNAARGIHGRNW